MSNALEETMSLELNFRCVSPSQQFATLSLVHGFTNGSGFVWLGSLVLEINLFRRKTFVRLS